MGKKRKKHKPLPAGAAPGDYILIETSNGSYYRKKRSAGTALNKACTSSNNKLRIASPLGKIIRTALKPFMEDLETPAVCNDLNVLLMRAIKGDHELDLSLLRNFNFQKMYVYGSLLGQAVFPGKDETGRSLSLHVHPAIARNTMKNIPKQLSSTRFTAIAVYFNVNDGTFTTNSFISPLFTLTETYDNWPSTFYYPETFSHYLLCLRAESYAGENLYAHPRTRALTIIDAGTLTS